MNLSINHPNEYMISTNSNHRKKGENRKQNLQFLIVRNLYEEDVFPLCEEIFEREKDERRDFRMMYLSKEKINYLRRSSYTCMVSRTNSWFDCDPYWCIFLNFK
jgi:hypothetical protein